MKVIFFECNMGAAGDMLMSAMLDLLDEPEKFIQELNMLNIPGVHFDLMQSVKCGITGRYIKVSVHGVQEDEIYREHSHHEHSHEHHHAGLSDINNIIDSLNVSDKIKTDAKNIYAIIADAESKVHARAVTDIHFHEVGTLDAIADVVGSCMLFDEIAPDKVITSPINTGSGTVHCAHGILPVPAPATALILKGVPIYSGKIQSELCTPTGAAILKYFTDEFMEMPKLQIEKIGYGMGKKDFEQANCVRAFSGKICDLKNSTDEEYDTSNTTSAEFSDTILELACNIDDMTAEAIGYAMEVLIENGAYDVFTTPIGMKKCRPGTMITCLCDINQKDKFTRLMFENTTTLGVRMYECERSILKRTVVTEETELGVVHYKQAEGFGVIRRKPEYEDVKKLAQTNNMSFGDVIDKLK